jgi:hypothetical protein
MEGTEKRTHRVEPKSSPPGCCATSKMGNLMRKKLKNKMCVNLKTRLQ